MVTMNHKNCQCMWTVGMVSVIAQKSICLLAVGTLDMIWKGGLEDIRNKERC